MKKITHLVLLISILTALFVSCSTNNEPADTQKSSALRIFLNEFKDINNINGRTITNDSSMCFEFVYPLTFSYNDGTLVSVSSETELISILENETSDLYLDGISFPFDLLVSGSTTPVTVANEDDFWDVINNCDIDSYDDYISSGPCYSFVYPFSLLTNNNQTISINNEQELIALFQNGNDDNYVVNFVYPFSVIYNNATVQISNEYEFAEMNNNCNYSNCNCPTVIDPVCVNVSGVIIEFPNACLAECAGYTEIDFVNCE